MNQMEQPQLYDIFPEWHIPFWQTNWFFWVITCSILLIAIGFFYLGYRWHTAKNKSETPYWQQTLSLIETLQQKEYTSTEHSKQCYFLLTAALKTYLNKRFAYPITSATDEQAAQHIDATDLDLKLKKNIQEIFRGCVLIKFANQQALDEQVQEHLTLAREVVQKTIPKIDSKTA